MNIGKRRKSVFVITVLAFMGTGLGSALTRTYPWIAIPSSIAGIVFSIVQFGRSEARDRQVDRYFDAQAKLLAQSGSGNLYIQALKDEIRKDGTSRNAKQYLQKALQINPNDGDGLYGLSSILVMELSFRQWAKDSDVHRDPRWPQAVKLVERGIRVSPKEHRFLDLLGILYDIKGDHVEARQWFVRSSHLRSDPDWHLLMCTSFGMSGDFENSLKEVEKAVQEGASGWVVEQYYGKALLEMGRYPEAFIHLKRAILSGPPDPRILKDMQVCVHMLGKLVFSGAHELTVALLLLGQNPRSSVRTFLQGAIDLFLGALFVTSKIIWNFSRKIPGLRDIHFRLIPPVEPEFSLGVMCIEKGHYEMAKAHFEKCYLSCPRAIAVVNNYSILLAQLGEKEKATKILAQALERHPTNHLLQKNKAAIETGDPAKPIAVRSLRDKQETQPNALR